MRKFNRYPPDFAALESTQNLRFLRRRYKDPMNGKKPDSDQDEWRIVHVGPGGVFTDSLVYNVKKDGASGTPAEKQTFIIEMQQTGGNPVDPNQGQVSIAERRSSERSGGIPGTRRMTRIIPNSLNNPAGIRRFPIPHWFCPGFSASARCAQMPTGVWRNAIDYWRSLAWSASPGSPVAAGRSNTRCKHASRADERRSAICSREHD